MTIPTFPTLTGLAFPVQRTPVWSTEKQDSLSGKNNRYQNFSYPLWKYELQFDMLRSDNVNLELQNLAGFFNQLNGATGLFQFADPDDGSVTNQAFGTGDGTTTTFQLVRAFGGFIEPVFIPVAGFVVKIAGTPTVAFTTSSIGQIIFNTPPAVAAALTWTGSFNWACRFDDDTIDFSKFMSNFWELKSLKFTTEKLP